MIVSFWKFTDNFCEAYELRRIYLGHERVAKRSSALFYQHFKLFFKSISIFLHFKKLWYCLTNFPLDFLDPRVIFENLQQAINIALDETSWLQTLIVGFRDIVLDRFEIVMFNLVFDDQTAN